MRPTLPPPAGGAPDVRVRLDAKPENVAVVRQALAGLAEALDWPRERSEDIALAVSEACSNVVVHAYPDDLGPLEALAWVGTDGLLVAVRDFGRGITPRTDSPGLGLGLPLIGSLADAVALGTGADGATEVRMRFSSLADGGRA